MSGQGGFDWDKPVPPSTDDPMSQAAAASKTGSASTDRQRIRKFIDSRGTFGATCDEVEAELGLSHQNASARIWELAGRNHKAPHLLAIKQAGKRKTRSGRSAWVWVALEVEA